MKVLIVTAHPDDLEAHAGGLALRLLRDRHDVTSVVTTPRPREEDVRAGRRVPFGVRVRECKDAHALLGIDPVILDYREQDLDVDTANRTRFRELIQDMSPDVVFTHSAVDVNPDHRATGVLALEPCLYLGVNRELFLLETCSASARPQTLGFIPSHYVDIADVVGEKRELVACHRSQRPEALWSCCVEMQRNRGKECGKQVAEAYRRLTRVGPVLDELRPLLIETSFTLPRATGLDYEPSAFGL